MTKKQLQGSHLSMLTDGRVALTIDKKDGGVDVLREITHDEILNLMTMLYLLHAEKNPDVPLQVIPLNDEQSIVVTILDSDQLKRTE